MADDKSKPTKATGDLPTVQDGVGKVDELTPEGKAVQDAEAKATEDGFRGVATDPTPNEHYTVSGVTAGKPTPETDPKQAAAVGSLKFR